MPVLWRIGLFLSLLGIAVLALAIYGGRYWPLGSEPMPKLELACAIVIAWGSILVIAYRPKRVE